jgi:uncharacterized membrane protein
MEKSWMKADLTPMHNWHFILFIQFLIDVVIVLDVPLARQVIGFLYLTYVPGFILVGLLRLNKLDTAQTLLFSTGFSVSSLMFLGLLVNELFPVLGVHNPLSPWPLMVAMNSLVVGFCLVNYLSKKDFRVFVKIQKPSPWILFFISLPFLSAAGTFIVNSGGSNVLSLLLIIITCGLVLTYVSLGKTKFSSNFRSLVLLMIALSLLLQYSLITNYIVGNDIYEEFYVFKLTNNAFYWNSSAPSPYINIGKTNAMLSVTVLPTIYSQILNVDGNLVFKFLYPFILSWLVVGLYKLYCTQLDKKTSFLSTLFFIMNSVFFMLFSSRQMIAELFYILLFLVLFDKKLESPKRNICYLIFSAAMVVSHYSIAYIFLLLILFIWLSDLLLRRIEKTIRISQVLSLFVFSFSWYIFISAASPFNSLLNTLDFIYKNLYRDFFNPQARGTMVISALGGGEVYSLWHQIGRIFFHISEFLIVIGFIKLMINRKRGKGPNREFKMLLFLNLTIILMCIVLPHFAQALHITRFYEIALLLLAPLCIIGGKAILVFFTRKRGEPYYASLLLILFLIPFFLFQSGFVYAITGDINWSIPLSIHRGEVKNLVLYDLIVNEQEVIAAQWLSQKIFAHSSTYEYSVHADRVSYGKVLISYGMFPHENMQILVNVTILDENSYVYLRRLNVVEGIIKGKNYVWNITELSPIFDGMNKIYSNGASEIYRNSSP